MAGYGTAFGRGLIIGAGAALLYGVARQSAGPARALKRWADDLGSSSAEGNRLIDWEWATRVAARAAGPAPALHPSAQSRLQADYEAMLRDIEQPIARYTGNDLSLANTSVHVMDRPGWIRANVANFRELLQPVEDFYRETAEEDSQLGKFVPTPGMQQAARMLLSAQIGILIGYLSRRVLGQYDLTLLSQEPGTAGKLYFVEPNLRQIEATLGVPGDELRRWIALHEATHAHEFELYPWVRQYLNSSMHAYLQLLVNDMRRSSGGNTLLTIANRMLENLRRGHNVIQALMTPEQRELMSRLQALMSLAEGYSNHVMNAVGRTLLPNFDLIHERVEHRRGRRSQAEQLFLRITGLSMKMEQYKIGEHFVDEVVRVRGIGFANRAWQAPENLPTEQELRSPERWIARLDQAAA